MPRLLPIALALAAALALLAVADAKKFRVHFPQKRPEAVDSPVTMRQVDTEALEAAAKGLDSRDFFYCEGHSSKRGSAGKSRELSKLRCDFVLKYLAGHGLKGAVLPHQVRDKCETGKSEHGPSVFCGKEHATGNANFDRYVDLHVVEHFRPVSCSRATCSGGRPVLQQNEPRDFTDHESMERKCCTLTCDSESVKCPFGSSKVAPHGPTTMCMDKDECVAKCCSFSCNSLWDTAGCVGTLVRKHDAQGFHGCGGVRHCTSQCCEARTCGMHAELHSSCTLRKPASTKCGGDGHSSCSACCQTTPRKKK
jgi:hypothetical protein